MNKSSILTCVLIALVLLIPFSLAAASFDVAKSTHPLQQITTDETGSTSVDSNADGVVDKAQNLTGTNGISAVKGTTIWSSIDFFMGSTNMWGIGANSNGHFYIDRNGASNDAFIINKNTNNVGISIPFATPLSK